MKHEVYRKMPLKTVAQNIYHRLMVFTHVQ